MNWAFLAAGGLSALWGLIHLFQGGKEVAAPLRTVPLDPVARDVAWLCWHMVTVVLALMAGFFLAAGLGLATELAPGLALAGTLIAAGFAALGIAAIPAIGQSYTVAPQGWLFVPVAALGAWGLI